MNNKRMEWKTDGTKGKEKRKEEAKETFKLE